MTKLLFCLKSVLGIFILICYLGMPLSANAGSATIGGGAFFSTSPYKSYDSYIMPFPILYYEEGGFFIKGLSAGYNLLNTKNHQIAIGATYSFFSFDSNDTNNSKMKHLDDRDATVTADLSYSLRTKNYGNLTASISADILDNSNGFNADIAYHYAITRGDFTINPSVGVRWDSTDQLDYYYGVSSKEARKSGLKEYSASSGISPYLDLNVQYMLSENWSAIGTLKMAFLSKEIKDSPMVDKSILYGGGIGLQYTF